MVTTVVQEGFATAPAVNTAFPAGFLAPTDFGNAALDPTTATPDMATPPTQLTDLDRILAAIGGINARLDTQNDAINTRFDGVTARFDALGGRLQAFESLGPRVDALDRYVTKNDGILGELDKRVTDAESLGPRLTVLDAHCGALGPRLTELDARVTKTADALGDLDGRITTTTTLITDTATRLDAKMGQVDVVATDKLLVYGNRLDSYGSRLGHVTETQLPNLQTKLEEFATRVATIEGRDASSNAPVADDDTDDPRPPKEDNVRFSPPDQPPIIGDAHLSPNARSRVAWAAAQNTRDTGGHHMQSHFDMNSNVADMNSNVNMNSNVADMNSIFHKNSNVNMNSNVAGMNSNFNMNSNVAPPPSHRDHRPSPIHHPDLPVNDRDRAYDLSSVGPLESPRLGDREHRARQLGVSRFDILGLAHSTYHAGADGFPTLTSGVLCKIGYNKISSSDVVSCHNDIIAVHRRILELWHNPVSHTFGPQVDRIITKSLKLLPTLASLTTENVVDFYDRLQESTTGLIIAIMPFDAIMLTNRFEGLCVPALGVRRYQLMSRALMELLPRLIPGTLSPQINAALSSVRYESNNGYDYLWRVLELTVPGFDPVVPIQTPFWSNADNVFSFAQSYLLYFRLQSKLNFHYDDRTRSSIFLRAIQFSDFADTVTTLQSHVNSFREQYDDGYLPPHLRIHGLATSINQNTQARMRDVITPRVRRLSTLVQGIPTVHRVNRDDRQRVGFKERDGGGKFEREYRSRGRPDPTRAPRERQRTPANPGRLARPDRNRRPFLPDVQCAACKRVGHVAKHCDMLATAICLERYMKRDMSDSVRDAIEKDWLTRWKARLDNPDRTPRQVLRAYVEELDITVAGLDEAMEWDCWVDDTPSDDSDGSDE
jgi:hypothetical protein